MLQRIALLLPFALLIKNAVVSATADPATPAQEAAAQKRADDERLSVPSNSFFLMLIT